MVNVILKYLPIALFLSNNHPEMYCILITTKWIQTGIEMVSFISESAPLFTLEGYEATHYLN